ncbi:Protein kintoun [Boothiomyces macroporosus]|uniref:Protein kintoun n=1 Tax=Boothiomyces macroporosus TaxID=261099 RepID=A0AAD5UMP8_9FUNG|nr:Protein kintoun [Boothiomyces macroporosus]
MSNQKFQPTAEELKKFEESFKNPEFKKLFFDYMNEISDPKNKELYEKELEQLEQEKGFKVRYVKPNPEFCIKTDNGKDKVYVNICSSPEIQQANAKRATGGTNWSIPYSLAQGREDRVKERPCTVYDCVFHPMTIKMSSNPQFKLQIINTAIEGINSQFKVKLNPQYKLLKKTNQGLPQMTMIRERDDSLQPAKESSLDFIEKLAKQQEEELKKEKPKIQVPFFKIVHQNKYNDYQKFTNERERQYGARPDALSIRIEVPLLKSLAGVELDINQKTLDLLVPDLYQLHLDLPFPVLEEEGEAKFEKANGILIVNVPVMTEVAAAAEQPSVGITELASEGKDAEKESLENENEESNIEQLSEAVDTLSVDPTPSAELKSEAHVPPIDNEKVIENAANSPLEEIKPAKDSSLSTPTTPKPPRFYCHQSLETISFIIAVPDVQDIAVETNSKSLKALIYSPYETRYLDLLLPYEFTIHSKNVNSENVCIVLQKEAQELWEGFEVKDGEYQKLVFRTFENVSNVIHVPKNDVVISAKRNHEKVIVNIEKKEPQTDSSIKDMKSQKETAAEPSAVANGEVVEKMERLTIEPDLPKETKINFVNNLLFELD